MNSDISFAIIPALFFIISMVISLGMTILWIWMIVDCATKEPEAGNDKLIWLLVIILTGGIGALIYLFARRPTRIRQFGQ